MFEAIGKNTNKVYATGSEADCFRKLALDYPTHIEDDKRRHGGIVAPDSLFPEPLILRKNINRRSK